MKSRNSVVFVRTDETTAQKLKVIAEREGRTLNRQVEYFCREAIARYEREHGEVEVPESPRQ